MKEGITSISIMETIIEPLKMELATAISYIHLIIASAITIKPSSYTCKLNNLYIDSFGE